MKKMIIAAVALLASTFAVQAQGVHPRLEVAGNFSTNIARTLVATLSRTTRLVQASASLGLSKSVS